MTLSEQARADAMADAETLRANDARTPLLIARAGNLGTNAQAWIENGGVRAAFSLARQASHAAFRAVPGLRG